jgi:hypothetical protein
MSASAIARQLERNRKTVGKYIEPGVHHAVTQIEGASYRVRRHADLIPENLRLRPLAGITPPTPRVGSRRRRPRWASRS